MKSERRKTRTFLLAVLAAIILALPARAVTQEEMLRRTEEITETEKLAQAVPEEAAQLLDGEKAGESQLTGLLGVIKRGAARAISGTIGPVFRQAATLFCICALCGVMSACAGKVWDGSFSPVAVCGAAAVLSVGFKEMGTVLDQCEKALSEINVFAGALLPSVAAASAAAGSPLTGSAASAAGMLVTSGLISVITGIFFPLIYIYIAIVTVDVLAPAELLRRISGTIKQVISTALKFCLTVYMAYSGVTGAMAAAADASAIKTARFAMSGAIPVVGSIVSDAAGAVIGGAALIKNAVGVFGMMSVAAICIVPFVSASVHYTIYKATAALCSMVAAKPVSRMIEGLGDGFGMAVGMLGAVAVLLFLTMTMAILLVRPV